MPQKFLWPELLNFWRTKSSQTIDDCVDVMSKMDILADPGSLMNKLVDIFAQRSLFVKFLSRVDHIHIPMAGLIRILEKLLNLSSESITECLESPVSQWDRNSNQLAQKEDEPNSKLSDEKILEMYNKMIEGNDTATPFDRMLEISNTIS